MANRRAVAISQCNKNTLTIIEHFIEMSFLLPQRANCESYAICYFEHKADILSFALVALNKRFVCSNPVLKHSRASIPRSQKLQRRPANETSRVAEHFILGVSIIFSPDVNASCLFSFPSARDLATQPRRVRVISVEFRGVDRANLQERSQLHSITGTVTQHQL